MKSLIFATATILFFMALGAISDKVCFGRELQKVDMTITAYSPLDPKAKKGRDYWGDPSVAADGSKVVLGVTCAAGKNIPFGAWIFIEGLGIYRVNDRGKKVKNNMIDVTMDTLQEARQFGRQKRKVWILK